MYVPRVLEKEKIERKDGDKVLRRERRKKGEEREEGRDAEMM